MVCRAEFGGVVLAECPRRATEQEHVDRFGFHHHAHLECKRQVWPVVESLLVLFYRHPCAAFALGDFYHHRV